MTEDTDGIVIGGCRLGPMIGRGGMGTVYEAVQTGVNRPVAVKLMPITSGDDAAIARFEREAQTAGALDHPHCLPIYAAGQSDGLLYLVMRLVRGPNLAQLIAAQGWLPPARAATIMTQISGAVGSAHRAGLVHRDLKPGNILIEERDGGDHAFVSDFGLMRAVIDDREITLAGQWLGTPEFAAPEQMRGETVGPAADIYALGAVLKYILGPRRSPAANAVISRAMAADPHDRYPTAEAFGAAAADALGEHAQDSAAAGPGASAALGAPAGPTAGFNVTQPTPSARPQHADRSRRARRRARVLVIGLAAVAVAAVLVLRHRGTGRTPTPPATHTTTHPATADRRLVTSAFTATVPKGWTPQAQVTPANGYTRWTLQSPDGEVNVDIDRTPNSTLSLQAHLESVEQAIKSTTPSYRWRAHYETHFPGGTALVWVFTVAGPGGQRVDLFRQIGTSQYAVLGSSSSLQASRSAASTIADSITPR